MILSHIWLWFNKKSFLGISLFEMTNASQVLSENDLFFYFKIPNQRLAVFDLKNTQLQASIQIMMMMMQIQEHFNIK